MAECEHEWVPHKIGGYECAKCPAWCSRHVGAIYDDPRADHDDYDDGEVRCACCKQVINIDRNSAIEHTCPTMGR